MVVDRAFPSNGITINILNYSLLSTNFSAPTFRSGITVNGGQGAYLENDGDSYVGHAKINANLVGTGSWSVGGFESMETGAFVGGGQTINVSAGSRTLIDHPTNFHGLIHIVGGGNALSAGDTITLEGIHGDAFTYQNDMLSISSAGNLVKNLRISEDAGAGFSVSDTSKSIVLSGLAGTGEDQQYSGVIAHVS